MGPDARADPHEQTVSDCLSTPSSISFVGGPNKQTCFRKSELSPTRRGACQEVANPFKNIHRGGEGVGGALPSAARSPSRAAGAGGIAPSSISQNRNLQNARAPEATRSVPAIMSNKQYF